MPSALLLAHIEKWVAELERGVQAFEDAVDEVEEAMEKAELEEALAKAGQLAELVDAANARLNEGLCAAQQVVANEQIDALPEPEQPPASAPSPAIAEQSGEEDGERHPPANESGAGSRRLIQASLIYPRTASSGGAGFEPLSHGATILAGRYRIVELLHARPRVNLYLAYRLASANEQAQGAPPSSLVAIREIVLTGLSPELHKCIEQVAFEEFVAPGLLGSPHLPGVGDRISVEHERHYLVMQLRPAREEHRARQGGQEKPGRQAAIAIPLADLLLKRQQWPEWLDMRTAYEWGIQLCRIVARLHRMGTALGDLNPSTVLVSSDDPSTWAPVLLVSWPPAPQFLPAGADWEQYTRLFHIGESLPENAFAAPEALAGQADERSDVYSLGAILYLLFTRYAPAAAALRPPVEHTMPLGSASQRPKSVEDAPGEKPASSRQRPFRLTRVRLTPFESSGGMALVPPHLFNHLISPRLEAILQRALALSPAERFLSVFAVVKALEAIDPTVEFVDHHEETNTNHRDSRITRVLERVRRSADQK